MIIRFNAPRVSILTPSLSDDYSKQIITNHKVPHTECFTPYLWEKIQLRGVVVLSTPLKSIDAWSLYSTREYVG